MKTRRLQDLAYRKVIPEELKNAALKALSFYPELKNVKIEFRYSERIRKSVMQAQPLFTTIHRSRKKRTYLVKVSRFFSIHGKQIPIQNMPEGVLVGWIGHELGHIMDYLRKNAWTMILFGLAYLSSNSFIISAERMADTYAVNHGLGDYILATKEFILKQAGMPKDYIQRIEKLYLPPEEIIELMENRLPEDP